MTTKAWLERLKAKRVRHDLYVLDRTDVPEGTCQLCNSKNKELRPYGRNGEWICFDCAMKDEATTERRFGEVVFGIKRH